MITGVKCGGELQLFGKDLCLLRRVVCRPVFINAYLSDGRETAVTGMLYKSKLPLPILANRGGMQSDAG